MKPWQPKKSYSFLFVYLMMFHRPGYTVVGHWILAWTWVGLGTIKSKSNCETERIWNSTVMAFGRRAYRVRSFSTHKFHWNSQQLAVKNPSVCAAVYSYSVNQLGWSTHTTTSTYIPSSSFLLLLQGKSITHKLVHLLSLASTVTCQRSSLLLIFRLTDGRWDSRLFSKKISKNERKTFRSLIIPTMNKPQFPSNKYYSCLYSFSYLPFRWRSNELVFASMYTRSKIAGNRSALQDRTFLYLLCESEKSNNSDIFALFYWCKV